MILKSTPGDKNSNQGTFDVKQSDDYKKLKKANDGLLLDINTFDVKMNSKNKIVKQYKDKVAKNDEMFTYVMEKLTKS